MGERISIGWFVFAVAVNNVVVIRFVKKIGFESCFFFLVT